MDMEEIKKYEGRLIELGYDWKIGNKGWCRGLVYNGQCYSFSLTPPDEPLVIGVMKIPEEYVFSVAEPKWEVSGLEKELLEKFVLKEGNLRDLRNIQVVNERSYR